MRQRVRVLLTQVVKPVTASGTSRPADCFFFGSVVWFSSAASEWAERLLLRSRAARGRPARGRGPSWCRIDGGGDVAQPLGQSRSGEIDEPAQLQRDESVSGMNQACWSDGALVVGEYDLQLRLAYALLGLIASGLGEA